MLNPHGHHLAEKLSEAGAFNRAILKKNGIDPQFSRFNLTHAPHIDGQHGITPQKRLFRMLSKADATQGAAARRAAVIRVLNYWAGVSARRI